MLTPMVVTGVNGMYAKNPCLPEWVSHAHWIIFAPRVTTSVRVYLPPYILGSSFVNVEETSAIFVHVFGARVFHCQMRDK